MRDARFDGALGAHRPEPRDKVAFVACDNLRPAVRDDDSRHTLFRAPADLNADSSVSDEPFAPLTNERTRESRPIADVNLRVFQCRCSIMNEDQVRRVENARLARADAVSHGRSYERVLDREGFESDAANLRRHALLDQLTIANPEIFQRPPRFLRRENRTERALLQTPGMVRMRVGKHDRVRMKKRKFSEPIKAAVDHHVGPAIRDEQRAVHSMPSGPRLDLPAGAEEREFHRAR